MQKCSKKKTKKHNVPDGKKFQISKCSAASEMHFKSIPILGEANSTLMGSQPSIMYVHTQSLLTCRMMGVVTYGLFMASIQCWNNYYYCYCYSRRCTMATWRWCEVLWLLLALSRVCRAQEGEVQITSIVYPQPTFCSWILYRSRFNFTSKLQDKI